VVYRFFIILSFFESVHVDSAGTLLLHFHPFVVFEHWPHAISSANSLLGDNFAIFFLGIIFSRIVGDNRFGASNFEWAFDHEVESAMNLFAGTQLSWNGNLDLLCKEWS